MKFLCAKCDEPMKYVESSGPDEGSLAVTFGCPTCGAQVSLLTNPGETQLAGALGIQTGGSGQSPSPPLAQVRDALRHQRGDWPSAESSGGSAAQNLEWTPEAQARLGRVPEGVMRNLTRQRVERLAMRRGETTVTVALMAEKYRQWEEGSARAESQLTWTKDAETRMERIPSFVRGMVVEAIEAYARQNDIVQVTPEIVEKAKGSWGGGAGFHGP